MKNSFTLLVGLPGSGKSTYAQKLRKLYGSDNTEVIESDEYRRLSFGSPEIQGDNNKLFAMIHDDILNLLKRGKNVIFDATNTSRKNRVSILEKLKKENILAEKECIVIATSFDRCLSRNGQRERIVPHDVMDRMYKSFQIPSYQEGWDVIDFEYDYDKGCYDIDDYLFFADDFNQENPHHSMTLGKHSREIMDKLVEKKVDNWVKLAGLLHDCGKPYAKVFSDIHGNPTEISHYYGHDSIGAYEAMFYLNDKIVRNQDYINALVLINYHMRPYVAHTEKAKEKLKNTVGEDLYYFLEILHEADKNAH